MCVIYVLDSTNWLRFTVSLPGIKNSLEVTTRSKVFLLVLAKRTQIVKTQKVNPGINLNTFLNEKLVKWQNVPSYSPISIILWNCCELKLRYSEKATKIWEISQFFDVIYYNKCQKDYRRFIFSNFVAFSEYLSFNFSSGQIHEMFEIRVQKCIFLNIF